MTTSNLRIYYNPRCSKCRAAHALLTESGQTFEVIDYLNNPPNKAELQTLLGQLALRPIDIVRKSEEIYRQHYQHQTLNDEAWLEALLAHPILIERPIVVAGQRAVLARPPEKLLALLQK